MTIEDKFNDSFGRWVQYCESNCSLSRSDPQTVIDCEAYREIVALGKRAISLIRKKYDVPPTYLNDHDAQRIIICQSVGGYRAFETIRLKGMPLLIQELSR